jgi:hypothetical protein
MKPASKTPFPQSAILFLPALLDHIKRFSFPGGQLQSASWFVMS